MEAILDSSCTLSANARLVALALVRRADKRGVCYPSLDKIAEDTGLARSTVAKVLAELVTSGAPLRIQVTHRAKKEGKGRATNVYHLSLDLSRAKRLKSAPTRVSDTDSGNDDLSPSDERPESESPPYLSPPDGRESLQGISTGSEPLQISPEPAAAGRAKDGPPVRKARQKKNEQPEGYQLVVDAYFRAFESARGAKPPFGAVEGKAVHQLIDRLKTADAAIGVIENAYADVWWSKTKGGTILDLARADYGRFVVRTEAPAHVLGQRGAPHLVQTGSGDWEKTLGEVIR